MSVWLVYVSLTIVCISGIMLYILSKRFNKDLEALHYKYDEVINNKNYF